MYSVRGLSKEEILNIIRRIAEILFYGDKEGVIAFISTDKGNLYLRYFSKDLLREILGIEESRSRRFIDDLHAYLSTVLAVKDYDFEFQGKRYKLRMIGAYAVLRPADMSFDEACNWLCRSAIILPEELN